MKPPDAKTILIRDMLDTMEYLGNSPTARIDARIWAGYFRRRAKRVIISKPVKIKTPLTKSK